MGASIDLAPSKVMIHPFTENLSGVRSPLSNRFWRFTLANRLNCRRWGVVIQRRCIENSVNMDTTLPVGEPNPVNDRSEKIGPLQINAVDHYLALGNPNPVNQIRKQIEPQQINAVVPLPNRKTGRETKGNRNNLGKRKSYAEIMSIDVRNYLKGRRKTCRFDKVEWEVFSRRRRKKRPAFSRGWKKGRKITMKSSAREGSAISKVKDHEVLLGKQLVIPGTVFRDFKFRPPRGVAATWEPRRRRTDTKLLFLAKYYKMTEELQKRANSCQKVAPGEKKKCR
ncbi:hypothetical protein AVEN_48507-1 [Araneus ventricosus]|uniref:Uncharacterized protein n=1 Tax=Araneus ventricosus TaxID=182803 RepID=A0A4Y2RLX8_ARAVE|nr:hypothetical protein AVEN_48507-1 [Araneus ventricosus]